MVRKWNVVISYRLWVSTHFPVYLLPPWPPPRLSGVKQQPSDCAHRFCGSGIRSGHSRDGLFLLQNIWGWSCQGRPKPQVAGGWDHLEASSLHVTGAEVTWTLCSVEAVDQSTFMWPPCEAWASCRMVTGDPEGSASEQAFPRNLLKPHDLGWSVVNKRLTEASPDCRAWEIRLCVKWEVGPRICGHFYNLPLPAFIYFKNCSLKLLISIGKLLFATLLLCQNRG